MGLFDQVVQAINDPDKLADAGQLGQVMATVQQLRQQGNLDASTVQAATSILGNQVRTSLKATRDSQGSAAAQALVEQGAQSGLAEQVLGQLLNSGQQTQVIEAIAQKTGLDHQQIQGMLPMLLPIVMQMLNSGASKTAGAAGDNPVLNTFLDADGDGDVDMGDMLGMAGRFGG